jgi:hypothetical protein
MLMDYKMYGLGMCLALDMVINNDQRFKLLCQGEGNLSNILIEITDKRKGNIEKAKNKLDDSVPLGNFVFVDHHGNMIDEQNPRGGVDMQYI